MNIVAALTIIAIVLSPVFAIIIGRYLDSIKEKKEAKLWVFRTLMATRATVMSHEHIRALNMIDVTFYGADKKSKNVMEYWKMYLDNLSVNTEGMSKDSIKYWSDKNQELLIDLLQKMALCLKYDFDKTSIKNTSYFPKGHEMQELENLAIRKGVIEILKGNLSLPIEVRFTKPDEKGQKFQNIIEEYFSGKIPIQVIIKS